MVKMGKMEKMKRTTKNGLYGFGVLAVAAGIGFALASAIETMLKSLEPPKPKTRKVVTTLSNISYYDGDSHG